MDVEEHLHLIKEEYGDRLEIENNLTQCNNSNFSDYFLKLEYEGVEGKQVFLFLESEYNVGAFEYLFTLIECDGERSNTLHYFLNESDLENELVKYVILFNKVVKKGKMLYCGDEEVELNEIHEMLVQYQNGIANTERLDIDIIIGSLDELGDCDYRELIRISEQKDVDNGKWFNLVEEDGIVKVWYQVVEGDKRFTTEDILPFESFGEEEMQEYFKWVKNHLKRFFK